MPGAAQTTPRSRSRRISKLLFGYVLKDFLAVLGCCLVGFLLLLLIGSLFDELNDFRSRGAPWSVVGRYFLLQQPQQFMVVLPMSLLLASTYCVASLCRHNEMTAIRGAGLSLTQACLPLLTVAVVAGVVHTLVGEFVVPPAARAVQHLHATFVDRADSRHPPEAAHLAFHHAAAGRDWLFGDFGGDGVSREILVVQFRPDHTRDWELRAEQGQYRDGRWCFERVVRTRFDAAGEFEERPPEHLTQLALKLPEDPRRFAYLWRLWPLDETSIRQLWSVLHEPNPDLSAHTRRVLETCLYYRCSYALTPLIAVLLGAPLAVVTGRTGATRSVVAAAVLLGAFHVISQFFVVLGKNHTLPPLVAGLVPALVFTGCGLWGLQTRR